MYLEAIVYCEYLIGGVWKVLVLRLLTVGLTLQLMPVFLQEEKCKKLKEPIELAMVNIILQITLGIGHKG